MDTKRSANFTHDEDQLLLELVTKNKGIVECKKSGMVSWKEKEECWKKIEIDFNSRNTISRNNKSLKERYKNLKKKTKAKYTENRQQLRKTGGGTCPVVNITDIDEKIKEMITDQIDGMTNTYDSDTILSVQPSTAEPAEMEILDEDDICIDITNNTSTIIPKPQGDEENKENSWTDYSSSKLQKPISGKLKPSTPRRKITPTVRNANIKNRNMNHELIEEKLNFVKLQRQKFLEEHLLKIELLNKKIELKTKKLELLNNETYNVTSD